MLNVRLDAIEADMIRQAAAKHGFKNASAYVRSLILQDQGSDRTWEAEVGGGDETLETPGLFHATPLGQMYHGDSLGLFRHVVKPGTVDLVVTSPPFGLVKKKEYGNVPADDYVEWFRPFAAGIRQSLKPTGSLVIDIGPAWRKGTPTKSLYQFELLLMLCKEFDFHLAQDFYWWNPCRMPAPAEWVNVRRLRVKDSVNPVWWLSPTPWPKASNKRVLTPYGEDQQRLFKAGYNAGLRPSGHLVSKNWGRDNGGAVPPNLIAAPNTVSDDSYQKYCRAMGIAPHPARFPRRLPEFFVRMLTDRDDLVVDPFAGSCLTGAVAQSLQRRWLCCELRKDYLLGALGRFAEGAAEQKPEVDASYRVPTSGAYALDQEGELLPCGGKDFRQLSARDRPNDR